MLKLQEAADSPPRKRNQESSADLPTTGYVREAQLIPEIIPVSSATLWRWSKNGRFPKPTRLGPRVTGWRVEDVRRWLAEKENGNG